MKYTVKDLMKAFNYAKIRVSYEEIKENKYPISLKIKKGTMTFDINIEENGDVFIKQTSHLDNNNLIDKKLGNLKNLISVAYHIQKTFE